jgi:hypothetical protein
LQDAQGAECIFINYSDGAPTHVSEGGYYDPQIYTKKVINGFKQVGMSIISYFITSSSSLCLDRFKAMYGIDATRINPLNMTDVSKSMNKKFLEISK